MDEIIKELKDKNRTLEMSNTLMEQEMALLRSEIAFLHSVLDNRCAEIARLKNRGFWERLFNR